MKKALVLILVLVVVALTACRIEPGMVAPGIEVVVEDESQPAPAADQAGSGVEVAQQAEATPEAGLIAQQFNLEEKPAIKPAANLTAGATRVEAGQAGSLLAQSGLLNKVEQAGRGTMQAASGPAGETLIPSARGGAEPQPMPFQDEPYVHPSGAFTFAVPEGFEILSEDEAGTILANDTSALMALFIDAEYVYSKQEMNQFITAFISGMFDNYRVLEQRTEADDSIFVAIEFDNQGTKGDGDYYFEQRGTVVFVLYFGSTEYEEMLPTWEEIIASYSVDPDAALGNQQVEEPASPRPGPRPLTPKQPEPTPTPAPETSPFAPQAGRSRLYVFNEYNQDLTFTINNGEHKIAVNAEVPIDMDPGRYTYTISVPGAAVNGEVEMGPNQSWAVGVRGDGAVYEPFQVYP